MNLTLWSVIVGMVLIGGVFLFNRNDGGANLGSLDNVTMIAGKQVIKIGAKAGYAPRITLAKAGVPSLIKFETNSTFDCSASLAIPDLNYKTILPPTGVTELDVPEQEAGTVLRGLCSMGMYSFEIRFS